LDQASENQEFCEKFQKIKDVLRIQDSDNEEATEENLLSTEKDRSLKEIIKAIRELQEGARMVTDDI
jgi:hypothetical protein